jgi:Glycosyltransferase family 87
MDERASAPIKRTFPDVASIIVSAVSGIVISLYARSASSPGGLFAGDLPAYLVGWRLAVSNPAKLYDLTTQRLTAGFVMEKTGSIPACPFNYPPHFALFGRLLPALTYNSVVVPWVIGSAILTLLGIIWWSRTATHRLHVIAVSAAVPATITGVLSGSIFPVVVVGLLMVVHALRTTSTWAPLDRASSSRWTTAVGSIGWILLTIKPHLALIVGFIALILARKKTLVTAGLALPILVVAPTLALGTSIWGSWITFLKQFSASTQDDLLCRIPLAAPNLEGTAARQGIAISSGLIWLVYLLALGAVCLWVWRARPSLTTAIAVGAAVVPLIAPHANPQDLGLCLPFVILSLVRLLSHSAVRRFMLLAICVLFMVSRWDRFMIEMQILVVGFIAAGVFRMLMPSPHQPSSQSMVANVGIESPPVVQRI